MYIGVIISVGSDSFLKKIKNKENIRDNLLTNTN